MLRFSLDTSASSGPAVGAQTLFASRRPTRSLFAQPLHVIFRQGRKKKRKKEMSLSCYSPNQLIQLKRGADDGLRGNSQRQTKDLQRQTDWWWCSSGGSDVTAPLARLSAHHYSRQQ